MTTGLILTQVTLNDFQTPGEQTRDSQSLKVFHTPQSMSSEIRGTLTPKYVNVSYQSKNRRELHHILSMFKSFVICPLTAFLVLYH